MGTILMKKHIPFNFKDFSSLDESQDAEFLVQSMDRMFSLETIRNIKKRAIASLELKQGDSVIELGCGLGHDSEALGGIVGANGKVVAIDSSKLMLEEAQRRSKHKSVSYQFGYANNLEYPDNYFSAAYADRLLVSQKDYLKVIEGMFRVTKPGGTICITDIDVGTALLYPYRKNLTVILLDRLAEIIENPFIGRELHVRLKILGVKNIKVFPESYIVRSFELVNTMIDFKRMINDLYHLGKYTKEQADLMLDDFIVAEQENNFIYGITLFTVCGKKQNN
jgi:ubiquinone/menaquinone biosynthesis C-methylase UbiE